MQVQQISDYLVLKSGSPYFLGIYNFKKFHWKKLHQGLQGIIFSCVFKQLHKNEVNMHKY